MEGAPPGGRMVDMVASAQERAGFAAPPQSQQSSAPDEPKVRKQFPETWIWADFLNG